MYGCLIEAACNRNKAHAEHQMLNMRVLPAGAGLLYPQEAGRRDRRRRERGRETVLLAGRQSNTFCRLVRTKTQTRWRKAIYLAYNYVLPAR